MTELTTLCYLERDHQYLMLHRIKKDHDLNKGKWIGVGGHLEEGESPDECLVREVREETGLTLTSYRARGIVTFLSGNGECEYMFLYTADGWTGELTDCNEGVLAWVDRDEVLERNLWEGDRVFLRLLAEDAPYFSLKLVYDGGERLSQVVLDGRELELFDVLDEHGERTGIVRERGVVHRDGSWHASVHMWIVRPNDRSGYDVLLQRRSMNKDSNPGCYDISSAGHMSAGQEPMEAAIREIGEELGITAAPEDLTYIGIHRGVFDGNFYGRPFHDREYSYCYLYTRPVDIESLHLQAEEVESVRWIDYDELVTAVQGGTLPNCIYPDELEMIRGQLFKRND